MVKRVIRYSNPDDVKMRLDSSVVSYKGVPYFATAKGMDLRLYTLEESSVMAHIVSANSSDLDIRSLELGYMNEGHDVYYVYRVPYRKQKQGMARDNLMMTSLHNSNWRDHVRDNHLLSKSFRDMLLDTYPTFTECMKSQFGLAFSKNFAIRRKSDVNTGKLIDEWELVFNQRVVGTWDKKLEAVQLDATSNHSVMMLKLSGYGVPLV